MFASIQPTNTHGTLVYKYWYHVILLLVCKIYELWPLPWMITLVIG